MTFRSQRCLEAARNQTTTGASDGGGTMKRTENNESQVTLLNLPRTMRIYCSRMFTVVFRKGA
jgi:hypothetical protein